MAGLLSGETSHHGAVDGHHKSSHDKLDEGSGRWYFSRKEIEENSPSRKDGIDLKKEAYLRKSYCTFLQDLGMRLKVPQVTIATAIIFCHRFFLRQSHAKNDRRTVAIVCMFLAGKVEETPRPLKDVILVSYEIIHKKDSAAVLRIKQKEVYEQQKELILLGERVVLVTLGFDLNVLHPYKPLVEAIKKFQVAQNALAQVAWNFVNDGLRTSLCLQFKPHHIAAGAIFLAAKFLKVKLPHEVWGQEFDVSPHQLEEVSNQMLELYEQNKALPSQASEAEGSAGNSMRPLSKGQPDDEHMIGSSPGGTAVKVKVEPRSDGDNKPVNPVGMPRTSQRNSDHGSTDISTFPVKQEKGVVKQEYEPINHHLNVDGQEADDHKGVSGLSESRNSVDGRDKHSVKVSAKGGATVHHSPHSTSKKLDLEKVISLKAAMERRKAQGALKVDPEDEIERELEDVEMPGQSEKIRVSKMQTWSEDIHYNDAAKRSPRGGNDGAEEGELETSDDADRGHRSPRPSSRKRKPESPLSEKHRGDYGHGLPKQSSHAYSDDRNAMGRRHEYQERETKRRLQENHV